MMSAPIIKRRSIGILLIAEMAAMSLWFISSAILPDMLREVTISPARQAALSSGVQAGFVLGALFSAIFGLADRFDPRRVFAMAALTAAIVNMTLLVTSPDSMLAIGARILTGALLAGVYPVGMKIVVGWGHQDRGFLVGLLVGALTLGSALPHLITFAGGANWRLAIVVTSAASAIAGILVLSISLGPHHGKATKFDPRVIIAAWTNRRVRLAYAGYLGHMWELYAMWAWIGAATAVSYGHSLPESAALSLAKLTAFAAIGIGALTSILAGFVADRVGKAEVAIVALTLSALAALLAALTFGGPIWVTFAIVLIWGMAVIPDSAQFSALVADASPAEQAGSLMTLQTALGFALTFATVQITPTLVAWFGWPTVLASLALGPAFGVVAMHRLRALDRDI
ncbi:MAG: MFS transporter [Pseudomonadota bacterium]